MEIYPYRRIGGKGASTFLSFRGGCCDVIPSGGPEPRSLPLLSDLSTTARGDKKAFGMSRRLNKEKRNGKAANAFFVSMSGFPFLFR